VEEQEKQRVLLELNLPPRQRTTLQQVYKFTLLLIQSDSIWIHIQTNKHHLNININVRIEHIYNHDL